MTTRRLFILSLVSSLTAISTGRTLTFAAQAGGNFKGEDIFEKILRQADKEQWQKLPIGKLIGEIGIMLLGTPYVGKTLDTKTDSEVCTVNLTGLDCVTFFESSLDLARMIKKGKKSPADLLSEVQFTRYRNGVVGDYTSRLHYTSDWFIDNQKKGVVQILSDLPGAEPLKLNVSIMTDKPQFYPQLQANKELIDKIKKQQETINTYKLNYVPLNKLKEAESQLQTGDIVGLCTSIPGEDISHTGMIFCTHDGVRHFMDASSRKETMKVALEPGSISERLLSSSKNVIGAMFARPLEVK